MEITMTRKNVLQVTFNTEKFNWNCTFMNEPQITREIHGTAKTMGLTHMHYKKLVTQRNPSD